jgi:alpha-glucosidase
LDCDDQFLIGNELLVAPVVQKGQRARDIYLPPGVWQDHWTGKIYEGPTVLHNHLAPLDQLPFFLAKG